MQVYRHGEHETRRFDPNNGGVLMGDLPLQIHPPCSEATIIAHTVSVAVREYEGSYDIILVRVPTRTWTGSVAIPNYHTEL